MAFNRFYWIFIGLLSMIMCSWSSTSLGASLSPSSSAAVDDSFIQILDGKHEMDFDLRNNDYGMNLIESSACQLLLSESNGRKSLFFMKRPNNNGQRLQSSMAKLQSYCRCLVGCLFDYIDFPQYYSDDIVQSQLEFARCGLNCLHYFFHQANNHNSNNNLVRLFYNSHSNFSA
ncbi:hypothetical protein DERF_000762 [Dermatophagoides farinae]|uniref:Uncharacterized protein n=1 Tax=Dermatophagoides farinae TaxID=6954 RepID=A0A922I9E9_DERFA|nr:hypothetical protein HUG17_8502 [Dermatophagoides farinae]KAH9526697.1 hypothetical protein DERF_000762 [Dermatophagoides farinae]